MRAIEIFNVDLDFFTDSLRLVGEGSFSWRAGREANAGFLDQFEDRAGRWIALYRKLGEKGRSWIVNVAIREIEAV